MDDLAVKMEWVRKWVDRRESLGENEQVRVSGSGDRVVYFTIKTDRGVYADIVNIALISMRELEKEFWIHIEHMQRIYKQIVKNPL